MVRWELTISRKDGQQILQSPDFDAMTSNVLQNSDVNLDTYSK